MKYWKLATSMGALLALTACGGGGGNPGVCMGSALVCPSVAPEPSPVDFVPVPDSLLRDIKCLEILALNGGDVTRGRASAQDAMQRGRPDLDLDKDGIACNGVF